MRFDARMWALGCKSSSYFDGVVGHRSSGHLIEKYLPNSLPSLGNASDRRYTNLDSRSNTSLRSYQMGSYSSEADEQNAGKLTVRFIMSLSHFLNIMNLALDGCILCLHLLCRLPL